jgi:hypothetical protein
MVAVYVIGPQDFIQTCEAYLSRLWWFLGDLIESLSARAFDAVRAAAIALYAVFLVLGLLAHWRGLRSGGGLFIVSLVFLLVVSMRGYAPGVEWFSAAVLAGTGAVVMTARLLHPPPMLRNLRSPWGPSGYRPMNQSGTPPPPP